MGKSYCLNIIVVLLLFGLSACEKDFPVEIKANKPILVVEGYINNEMPLYNYVVLSRSQDYYSPDFQSVPVSGAEVTITEGSLLPDNTYRWDSTSKTRLTENPNLLPAGRSKPSGVYYDARLLSDTAYALRGKPGNYYLLEIEAEGQHYSAVTFLEPPVPIDSLSSGFHFVDENGQTKARITVHYKDPDTIGNTQQYYWQRADNRHITGWGGFSTSRFTNGTDDLTNGQLMNVTLPGGFVINDIVDIYLVSVERKVYNFWESFKKAKDNEGPFATPVTLLNTINGENVVGCFSGFGVSRATIVIR